MANTRGGLIVYGVTDQPITFKGITEADANINQYAQWVRNHVQPYLTSVGLYCLRSDDGSQAVLVVDVPASELAPHCVDFDPKTDRAKSQRATVTPYRDGPHTAWMAEHQIARAYADRLNRAAEWQESFNELRDWTIESLDGRAGQGHAWLVVVARPLRPIPRSAPRLDREVAIRIVEDARTKPVATFEPVERALQLLGGGFARTKVGLNAWVVTTDTTASAQGLRDVTVELHHDGSLVFVVNLSKQLDRLPPMVGTVNVGVVEQACVDLEGLLLQAIRAERIDSPMRVQASVVSERGFPLAWARRTPIGFEHGDDSQVHRIRPVTVEVPVGATEDNTRLAAAELAGGVLNQFGMVCSLPRYIV